MFNVTEDDLTPYEKRNLSMRGFEDFRTPLSEFSFSDLVKEICYRKIALEDVPTHVLLEELRRREGVKEIWVEPYEKVNIPVEGWASVFIVVD